MAAPIAIPPEHSSGRDHRAGEILARGQRAPRGSASATRRAFGNAGHGWAAHNDVASAYRPTSAAEQVNERISGLGRAGSRAGLIVVAGSVHLARSDSGNADVRAFGASDRSVAVVDVGWGAGESLAGADDRGGKGKQAHGVKATAACARTKAPARRYSPSGDLAHSRSGRRGCR